MILLEEKKKKDYSLEKKESCLIVFGRTWEANSDYI